MYSIKNIINLLMYLSKFTNKNQWKLASYNLFFIFYAIIKLNVLLKMQLKLHCIPDEVYAFLLMKHEKSLDCYGDDNLYLFSKLQMLEKPKKWYYLCSTTSKKKYKVRVIFTNDIQENNIYGSIYMKLNIIKYFNLENSHDSSYFLIPILDESEDSAIEVKISLISNPYECTNDLIDKLLKSFFFSEKYLRINDIFTVDVKKYLPQTQYILEETDLDLLHFKVNSIQLENQQNLNGGSFVLYGKTSLIQEANVNSYIPRKCVCDIPFDTEKCFSRSLPPIFNKPIKEIQACIAPFIQTEIYIEGINPVFLFVAPTGSKKCQIIKAAAETLGLHLIHVYFSDLRYLTAIQTEIKLQKIFREAENCTPCILMFQDIEIFGTNAEGRKDERICFAFITEIEKLYNKEHEYPIIIIATSNTPDIYIDFERIILEKIIISYPDHEERYKALSWLIESKHLTHQADLQHISKICFNFVLTDLDALVQHAVKNYFKNVDITEINEDIIVELSNDHLMNAYEYMQSLFSKEIGAPTIPKVHWDDIGGLADVKKEIIRRIRLPLMNIPNMNKSGLLLYGPPGTGKTLLAKAVATECQLCFLSVKGPELLNMYVGQSEKNVRQVFEQARSVAPCIIFFDELDSLAPKRGKSGDGGGVMDRVVSQLLAEMDGLDSSAKIFVIAATNRPDLIDTALLRPGRFDKLIYVGICSDVESHLSVMKALTRRFNMEKGGEELDTLVHQLPSNLTGADLYAVSSNAWMNAVRRLINSAEDPESLTAKDVIVTLDDFLNASKNLVPSVSKEDILHYEKLRDQLSSK